MGKKYIRVDDRLIHGQTIVAWCPSLGVAEIIAIDDESAKNQMLKSIMTLGVPKQYRAHIVTSAEARDLLAKNCDYTRLVICKYPHILIGIQEEIRDCEIIILGNLAKRPETIYSLGGATGIFYLSRDDVADIDTLIARGFKVNFQQLPNTQVTSWDSFKKSI